MLFLTFGIKINDTSFQVFLRENRSKFKRKYGKVKNKIGKIIRAYCPIRSLVPRETRARIRARRERENWNKLNNAFNYDRSKHLCLDRDEVSVLDLVAIKP